MNEKMNVILEELKNAEIGNPLYYWELVDTLKSIRFLIDDVRNFADLKPEEREKLNCAFSLAQLVEKRLSLDEFDTIVELLGIDREAV